MNYSNHMKEQPTLLKAIELILAKPSDIRKKVQKFKARYQKHGKKEQDRTMKDRIANQLISSYSNKAGLSGGATAMIGIIPGLGTAIEIFGGATADMALCMKFQIEMTMAIACLYGQDIEAETGKKQYFIIAGLSTINIEAIKQGGEQAAKLLTRLIQHYLEEASFDAIRILFKKVSITLSKKLLQKAIPFGIGAVIGFSSNKTLTWMVGQRVKDFFAAASISTVYISPIKEPEINGHEKSSL